MISLHISNLFYLLFNRQTFKIVAIGLFCLLGVEAFANLSISLNATHKMLNQPVTKLAIQDVQQLLHQACDCKVSINKTELSLQINFLEPNLAPMISYSLI